LRTCALDHTLYPCNQMIAAVTYFCILLLISIHAVFPSVPLSGTPRSKSCRLSPLASARSPRTFSRAAPPPAPRARNRSNRRAPRRPRARNAVRVGEIFRFNPL
jgi:hypothetical protein